MSRTSQLAIRVVTPDGQVFVEGVQIQVKAVGRTIIEPEYDPRSRRFIAHDLRPGDYRLEIEAYGFEPDSRVVRVHPRPTEVGVILRSLDRIEGQQRLGVIWRPQSNDLPFSNTKKQETLSAAPFLKCAHYGADGSRIDQSQESNVPALSSSDGVPEISGSAFSLPESASELSEQGLDLLKTLQEAPIESVGLVLREEENLLEILTGGIYIRFRPHVSPKKIDAIFEKLQAEGVRPLTFSENLYFSRVPPARAQADAADLALDDLVEFVELEIRSLPEQHGLEGARCDRNPSWDRRMVLSESTRQELAALAGESAAYGDPDIVVGVIDRSLRHTYSLSLNPELLPYVTPTIVEPDPTDSNHGTRVAGVAVGKSLGMAPDCSLRLIALESELLLMEIQQAAMDSSPAGVDIFVRAGKLRIPAQTMHQLVRFLATFGRKGRGCIFFASAGNDSVNGDRDVLQRGLLASVEGVIGCGATTLRFGREVKADYSNIGDIELSAPSSAMKRPSGTTMIDAEMGTWSTDFCGFGQLGWGPPLIKSSLAVHANAGAVSLRVSGLGKFQRQSYLLVGGWTGELVQVIGEGSEGEIPISPPLCRDHSQGESLWSWVRPLGGLRAAERGQLEVTPDLLPLDGAPFNSEPQLPRFSEGDFIKVIDFNRDQCVQVKNAARMASRNGQIMLDTTTLVEPPSPWARAAHVANHQTHLHGGTSSSTPLCAGLAALALSANPDLSWVEVRDILRRTAIKLDPEGEIGGWRSADGDATLSISEHYGYGRVDGAAALRRAQEWRPAQNLTVRNTLQDRGVEITSAAEDSPDIWICRPRATLSELKELEGDLDTPPPTQVDVSDRSWIYVRVTNTGSETSLEAWVRILLVSGPDVGIYPEEWMPQTWGIDGPGRLHRRLIVLGELALPRLSKGESIIVEQEWDPTLGLEEAPEPEENQSTEWQILVDVTPHDGPLFKNRHIEENSNLARRRIQLPSRLGRHL